MGEHKNTLPGYEVENATVIPDDEDPGVGFSAGDTVVVIEGSSEGMYDGEEGIVQAVLRGQGFYENNIIVDVLIDGTEEPWRFPASDLEGV